MDKLPTSLEDCMRLVQAISGQLKPALMAVPATRAHAEACGLFEHLESLLPQVLKKHQHVQELFRTAKQDIRDKVAKAEDHLARGKAIQAGDVSQAEVLRMQQEAFGTKFTLPPVPQMPEGWSSVLAQELTSSALQKTTTPILPTESNAWNDWQLETNI